MTGRIQTRVVTLASMLGARKELSCKGEPSFVADGGIVTAKTFPYQRGSGDKRRLPSRIDPR
jgi:hypothetical protein